jgi:nitroreductase/NAD-dependent dihydropyrimidine dehydrogenase PreA subunit
MARIAIDADRCTRCGTCVRSCSENVFALDGPDAVPRIVRETLCIACGHCVAQCPPEAILHADFPEGTIHVIHRERAPSPEQVIEMLRMRRSIRLFKEASVEKDLIEKVLDGARFAPSAHNFQATEYVVVLNGETLRTITGLTARYYARAVKQLRNPLVRALYGLALTRDEVQSALHLLPDLEMVVGAARRGEDPFLHDAPCLLVAHARRSIHFPEANAILALHNATLVAQALGLGGFLVGYLVGACKRDRRIPRLLGIPRSHEVYGALALGHPGEEFTKWVERRPVRAAWM